MNSRSHRLLYGLLGHADASILPRAACHAHGRGRKHSQYPWDGNTPVTFTRSSYVGRFVTAIVDIDKLDRISVLVGDKMALNEAVKLAEAVKGK